jgi:hypothetical protein
MAARVISFRVDDEVMAELEKRNLPNESVMLTAQRILSEALGIIKPVGHVRVEELIDTAMLPLQTELTALRDDYNESIPQLENSVRLLEQVVFGEIPIHATLEELRSRLDILESQRTEAIEPTQKKSQPSELVSQLSELLDNQKFPSNSAGKLKKRLVEIIETLS